MNRSSELSPQLKPRRRAAVLVCVLVVLFIVGGLAVQSIQTMSVIRRGDDQRQSLQQARELLELGQRLVERAVMDEGESITMTLPSGAEGIIVFHRIDNEKIRLESDYRAAKNRSQKATLVLPIPRSETDKESTETRDASKRSFE